jgi:hypothetical protein
VATRHRMVKSCDASLLLHSTREMESELAASRNFKYIDVIKAAVERECADILALAARQGRRGVAVRPPRGHAHGAA